MQDYKCVRCGKIYNGGSLFICPDDKIRCGPCVDIIEDAKYGIQRDEDRRADDVSNTHDHVEGRIGEGR